MSTSEERAEWAKLADAATEGPWEWTEGLGGRKRLLGADGSREVLLCAALLWPAGPDASLIAAAPTAVPALLADVERLTAERDALAARIEKARAEVEKVTAIEHPNGLPDDADCLCCHVMRALDEEVEA